jgi:hypothetical protein
MSSARMMRVALISGVCLMSERVDSVSIVFGGFGDVLAFCFFVDDGLYWIGLDWVGLDRIGLDWVWMCNAMRSDAKRYDMIRTRHEALVCTWLMRHDAMMTGDMQAREGGLALHSLGQSPGSPRRSANSRNLCCRRCVRGFASWIDNCDCILYSVLSSM